MSKQTNEALQNARKNLEGLLAKRSAIEGERVEAGRRHAEVEASAPARIAASPESALQVQGELSHYAGKMKGLAQALPIVDAEIRAAHLAFAEARLAHAQSEVGAAMTKLKPIGKQLRDVLAEVEKATAGLSDEMRQHAAASHDVGRETQLMQQVRNITAPAAHIVRFLQGTGA